MTNRESRTENTDTPREAEDSTREPASNAAKGSSRAVVVFLLVGLLCSLTAIGIGVFGTVNVGSWAFSTVEARWTAQAEERAASTATAARGAQIATEVRATETAQAAAEQSATGTARAARAERPSDWRRVFIDSFTADQHSWPLYDEVDVYTTHKSEIVDGVYRWEALAHRGFVWWIWGSQPVSDFYLSVEVRRVSGTRTGSSGLVFRLNNRSYYAFVINDSQRFAVMKSTQGRLEDVISWKESDAIQPDGTDVLTVVATGSNFSFFINGQWVAEIEDVDYEQGRTGLTIGLDRAGEEAVFEFDNFEVWTPAP